ncbi:MAG: hypothetical protein APF81_08190 [Desulfosporosinus sp. BRH_c37]|nr:MAG: hypothetical protein APF81_08190 [Desulfosporosinus sp. BRH_c37]
MSKEFEIVGSSRRTNEIDSASQNNKLADALEDNMGSIIEIAKNIVDIQKMKVQSEAILAKMAEDRKMLLTEAEVYVMRKNVDTKSVVDRMRIIQDLLRDFYSYNQTNATGLSGEEFTKIISDVLATMG